MSDIEPPREPPFSTAGPAMRGPRRRMAQLTWFAALWLGGVLAVAAFAYAVRALIL